MPSKKEKEAMDKRSSGERAQVQIDIDLSTYGPYFLSKLENVSIGGAFIRTRNMQPVGTDVKLRFRLPTDQNLIEAAGEVVWVFDQAGRSHPNSSGMGIKFKEIQEQDRERIAKFIDLQTKKRR